MMTEIWEASKAEEGLRSDFPALQQEARDHLLFASTT